MLKNKRPYIYNVPNLLAKRQSLRNNSTAYEKILWQKLKNSQTGYKFRRQFSIRGYILDFYCPSQKLAIEIDGPKHLFTKTYDDYRTRYLEAFEVTVIRFTNEEIASKLEQCLLKIKSVLPPLV